MNTHPLRGTHNLHHDQSLYGRHARLTEATPAPTELEALRPILFNCKCRLIKNSRQQFYSKSNERQYDQQEFFNWLESYAEVKNTMPIILQASRAANGIATWLRTTEEPLFGNLSNTYVRDALEQIRKAYSAIAISEPAWALIDLPKEFRREKKKLESISWSRLPTYSWQCENNHVDTQVLEAVSALSSRDDLPTLITEFAKAIHPIDYFYHPDYEDGLKTSYPSRRHDIFLASYQYPSSYLRAVGKDINRWYENRESHQNPD